MVGPGGPTAGGYLPRHPGRPARPREVVEPRRRVRHPYPGPPGRRRAGPAWHGPGDGDRAFHGRLGGHGPGRAAARRGGGAGPHRHRPQPGRLHRSRLARPALACTATWAAAVGSANPGNHPQGHANRFQSGSRGRLRLLVDADRQRCGGPGVERQRPRRRGGGRDVDHERVADQRHHQLDHDADRHHAELAGGALPRGDERSVPHRRRRGRCRRRRGARAGHRVRAVHHRQPGRPVRHLQRDPARGRRRAGRAQLVGGHVEQRRRHRPLLDLLAAPGRRHEPGLGQRDLREGHLVGHPVGRLPGDRRPAAEPPRHHQQLVGRLQHRHPAVAAAAQARSTRPWP